MPISDLQFNTLAAEVSSIQDEINQIIAELGTAPEGAYADVRARLDILEARLGALVGGGAIPTAVIGGDLSPIDEFTQRVVGLQSNPVSTVTPTNGQVLTWDAADGYWTPEAGGGGGGGGGAGGGNTLVFRPQGTTTGNVFATWAALWTARQLIDGPATIYIDDSLIVTTVDVSSNGAPVSSSTINVLSTAPFQSAGAFNIVTSIGVAGVSYTGTTPTSFTGCVLHNGGGTISTGAAVMGPAAIETSAVIYDLKKDTSIVGFRNATDVGDLYNAQPFISGAPRTSSVWFMISDTVIFKNPSYFENLLIWGVDTAAVGVFQVAAPYSSMDVTAKDVHFGNVLQYMFGSSLMVLLMGLCLIPLVPAVLTLSIYLMTLMSAPHLSLIAMVLPMELSICGAAAHSGNQVVFLLVIPTLALISILIGVLLPPEPY